jgi:hypothetical protein
MKRRQLLNLFKQNTGKAMIRLPSIEPSVNQLVGYQKPRFDKFKWQGKME